MKTHYRHVTFEKNFFTGISITSIKIPCGPQGVVITRDSTKDESKVDCERCLEFIEAKKQLKNKSQRIHE